MNETINLTVTEIARAIAPLVQGNLLPLINVLKAAGILFIIYLIILTWQIINRIIDRKRFKRIEEKLDLLLKKENKKKLN